jgi:nitrite reductase/ring-hydroxylating ferredoxin subunit
MTTWTPVGKVSDFQLGSAKAIDLNGETICLIRNKNGFHAVTDACSHGAVSLSEGTVTSSWRWRQCRCLSRNIKKRKICLN